MSRGLRRFHESSQSHFVTSSCYRRQPKFNRAAVYDLFPECLERMRCRFDLCVYGYVVTPEHVHLLLSEPNQGSLADAIHYLKLRYLHHYAFREVRSGRDRVGVDSARPGVEAVGAAPRVFLCPGWPKKRGEPGTPSLVV